MKKNIALKSALFASDLTQRELARKTKIPESFISMAVNGKMNLTLEQFEKISNVLNRPVAELMITNKGITHP